MELNTITGAGVYRFIVEPRAATDPRSDGYLHDAHSLGLVSVTRIRCCDLVFLLGSLSDEQLDLLKNRLLHDPVTQTVRCDRLPAEEYNPVNGARILDVALRPGVTDPVAEQILRAAHLLGVYQVQAVSTGLHFFIEGQQLDDAACILLANRLLSNPVIQRFSLGALEPAFPLPSAPNATAEVLPVRGMNPAQLLALSQARRAALDLAEMQAIQAYCLAEGRDLTDIEFEMIAQTWSEHCVHKTFKACVDVQQPDGSIEQIDNLFNQTIRAATRQIAAARVRSAFVDNAGILDFDEDNEISFKVETHNHPSAIEPFGGANTGVGGVIRDVLGVSAKPIAATDVLCFGPQDTPLSELPPGVLHPRRILSGVVAGVQDYGNKIGLPTVSGGLWFDPGYTANPLVFCGCVGIAPKGSHPRAAQPGDHIIVIGGRTGRDGLRGATFSSMTMDAQTGAVAGASVQIGAPVVEKGVIDVTLQARDLRLYTAITDCGAGGLSSAVGEMVSDLGGVVQLDAVPLKYPGLAPWEIWLSEAQERMVLAVPAANLPALIELCQRYGVDLTDIGHFVASGRLVVRYGEKVVLDLSNHFLHNGLPQRSLKARVVAPPVAGSILSTHGRNFDGANVLLGLLSHANIASKANVIRLYDHEVQGGTVIKPLTGVEADAPSDAVVLKPLGTQGSQALVLSAGLNPEYGKLDAGQMALNSIDEAVRNAVAVGADPDSLALLDNFCWGDPLRPETMGELVQAARGCYQGAVYYAAPFISGKDSFNNEYLGVDAQRHAIPPTLLISAIGVMEHWQTAISMDLKAAGNLLYLVGQAAPTFGGSHYNLVCPTADCILEEGIPALSPITREVYRALHSAMRQGWVAACHDLSEGGLAVAAAEMCIGGRLGLELNLPEGEPLRWLFGETTGSLLVEIAPDQCAKFERTFSGLPLRRLGWVVSEAHLRIAGPISPWIDLNLSQLVAAWQQSA